MVKKSMQTLQTQFAHPVQLCDGASPAERVAWQLGPARGFHYLAQSSCFELPGVKNAEEYKRTRRAMSLVGIPDAEQVAVCATVAAVLHLGNIAFVPAREEDSSAVAAGRPTQHLAVAAALLGVDAAGLGRALTTRTRHTVDGASLCTIWHAQACHMHCQLSHNHIPKALDIWYGNHL